MAKVYVKQDGSGDYTSLAAAISAGETDIEIQGSWTADEDAKYTINANTVIEATGDSLHPQHPGEPKNENIVPPCF